MPKKHNDLLTSVQHVALVEHVHVLQQLSDRDLPQALQSVALVSAPDRGGELRVDLAHGPSAVEVVEGAVQAAALET